MQRRRVPVFFCGATPVGGGRRLRCTERGCQCGERIAVDDDRVVPGRAIGGELLRAAPEQVAAFPLLVLLARLEEHGQHFHQVDAPLWVGVQARGAVPDVADA